jgi:hypothetical protein
MASHYFRESQLNFHESNFLPGQPTQICLSCKRTLPFNAEVFAVNKKMATMQKICKRCWGNKHISTIRKIIRDSEQL